MEKTYILNKQQIALKLKRMALEIAERNTGATHLILAGVLPNGHRVAAQLQEVLAQYFEGEISNITILLNKKQPKEVQLSATPEMEKAVVVLVDDVANSGKTLTYALKPFLEHFPQKIQTCVLVERTHKLFPVTADYVGLRLATTLQEYIEVETENGELTGAWVA